jgi:hypothetical protein
LHFLNTSRSIPTHAWYLSPHRHESEMISSLRQSSIFVSSNQTRTRIYWGCHMNLAYHIHPFFFEWKWDNVRMRIHGQYEVTHAVVHSFNQGLISGSVDRLNIPISFSYCEWCLIILTLSIQASGMTF